VLIINIKKKTFVEKSGKLQIVAIDPKTGGVDIPYTLETKNVYGNVRDITFLPNQQMVCNTMKSEITLFQMDGTRKVLYEAEAHPGEDYCSIPTEIRYGKDGYLYFTDVGKRGIYRLDMQEPKQITCVVDGMEAVAAGNLPYEEFADIPLFYSFCLDDMGNVDILASKAPDEGVEEEYAYVLYHKDIDGQVTQIGRSFPKSLGSYLPMGLLGIAIILALVFLVILLTELRKSKLKLEFSENARFQIPIIVTAMLIALVVFTISTRSSDERYYTAYMDKLEIVANLIGKEIAALGDVGAYHGSVYEDVNETVSSILNSDSEKDTSLYCVLYREHNDVVQILYSDEDLYGTGCPMAGNFQGSGEQEIFETKEPKKFYSLETAEGNYMFLLALVVNEKNEVIALVEVGTDFYMMQQEDKRLFTELMILVISAVVLLILIISEGAVNFSLRKFLREKKDTRIRYDAGLVRPMMFLFCVVTNMPNTFIPIYGKQLWHAGMMISPDMAGALPISAEMGSIAIATLCMGKTVDRVGTKKMCLMGTAVLVAANMMYGLSSSWYLFTGAAILNGFGAGIVMLALNTYIMGYDEEQCTKGFIHYNAAYLAGMNIGVIVGASIAEQFGYHVPFFVGAVITLISIPVICFCMENRPGIENNGANDENDTHTFQTLWKFITFGNVIKFYLLFYIPFMCCEAFTEYVFPIFGEDNNLSMTEISMAFLLAGVIAIYLGSTLTNLTGTYLGTKKSLLLAGGSNIAALIIFAVFPSVINGFIVVGVLAVTDCYALTQMNLYYSQIQEVKEIGDGQAMSVYGTFENIAMLIGPILFAELIRQGGYGGVLLFGILFLILLIVFGMSRQQPKKL